MHIDDYSFGRICVDGVEYRADLILLPDRVAANWWRQQGHSLCPDDLAAVVEAAPEVLIVGTGAKGIMNVPDETASYLEERGIELIVAKTPRACDEFNRLAPSKRAAAALHLTC